MNYKELCKQEFKNLDENAKFYENKIIIKTEEKKDFFKIVNKHFENEKTFMKEICDLNIRLEDYKIEDLGKNCVIVIKILILN